MKKLCYQCGIEISSRSKKYCSNKCQSLYQFNAFIEKWKRGEVSGNRGINTKNISQHIKRFLMEKYGERCSVCGWHKRHPNTNRTPLEIDHIDGNADNNKENNLRLICPNCHALTPTYRNLNRGQGRSWRNAKTPA